MATNKLIVTTRVIIIMTRDIDDKFDTTVNKIPLATVYNDDDDTIDVSDDDDERILVAE